MQATRLYTDWDADDAHCVIGLLDELRDALRKTCAAEIIEAQQAMYLASRKMDLPFDDDLEC